MFYGREEDLPELERLWHKSVPSLVFAFYLKYIEPNAEMIDRDDSNTGKL